MWLWRVTLLVVVLALTLVRCVVESKETKHDPLFAPGRECFCKVCQDGVGECPCHLVDESIDAFNNHRFFPLLQQLLQKNFFRYYKVDMEKRCPFWTEEGECANRECGIENCDDEVPLGLKKRAATAAGAPGDDTCGGDANGGKANAFDPLDQTLSPGAKQQFIAWARHDDAENKFCDMDGDEDAEGMHYVDLLRNPERYTGYKGNSAQRVWGCIYRENCFKPNPKFDKNFLLYPSITATGSFGAVGKWVRNVEMFKGRFLPERTWGEGPQRLKNLYFTYMLLLRALDKAAPYLTTELFYTGDDAEDGATRDAVRTLLAAVRARGHDRHFDETVMFQQHGSEALARQLKEEFRLHFHNVSRIMDCVGCDKCRLWGKLQAHGMGTALKVLFADLPRRHGAPASADGAAFQLKRNDVVALFQSLGRYAASIREVDEFRTIITAEQTSHPT